MNWRERGWHLGCKAYTTFETSFQRWKMASAKPFIIQDSSSDYGKDSFLKDWEYFFIFFRTQKRTL